MDIFDMITLKNRASLGENAKKTLGGSYVINVGEYPIIVPEANDTNRVKRAVTALAKMPVGYDSGQSQLYNCGGILFFPAGNWKFDEVDLPMGVEVRGEGWWNTRITSATSGKSAFKILKNSELLSDYNGHNSHFTAINFYGGTYTGDPETGVPVIDYGTLTSIEFSNCWFTSAYGLRVKNCTEVKVVDCIFDIGDAQIYLYNVNCAIIDRNILYSHDRESIYVINCNTVTISKNHWVGTKGISIKASGCVNLSIKDNNINHSGTQWANARPISIDNSTKITIKGNKIDGGSFELLGITIYTNNDFVFLEDNEIYNCYIGIDINGVGVLKVKNNKVDVMNSIGIKIQTVSYLMCDENFIGRVNTSNLTGSNQASSLYLRDISDGYVRKNNLKDSDNKSLYGISVTGTGSVKAYSNEIIGSATKYFTADTVKLYRDKKTLYDTSYPTTGTWEIGDRIINTSPSVGNPKSWVCTVEGTPGTWNSEGNL